MQQNKCVIITGASSGIGEALAKEYASLGRYNLVLAARNIDKLNVLAKTLESQGVEVLTVKTDVSKEADCENLIKLSVEKFDRIDILINNAGISMRAIFEDVEISVLKRLMDVNFWGTVYCSKFALPYLLKTKGSLVGIISIAGYIGLPARTGYSASKYAMRGFLDTVRVENMKKGLHVLVAAPGFTASNVRSVALVKDGSHQGDTPRDESKMMSSETCAKLIRKAIDKRKRTLIMTFVEGKFTVWLSKRFPALLDKLSYNHMAKEPDSPLEK